MSAKAKEIQGYLDKPLFRRCRACNHLIVRNEPTFHGSYVYYKEYLSCGIGGFAVNENAICDQFVFISL